MHSKINKIIEEALTDIHCHYKDPEEPNDCDCTRNALQDLRNKSPQLTEEIVRVVVDIIEKHKAQHIDSIKEPFVKIALEARNDGLNEIINLLKK
jgi:hypothetical protein